MSQPIDLPLLREPRLKRFSRLQTRIGLAVGALIICLALALAGLLVRTAETEFLALKGSNLESLSDQMARQLADGMNQFLGAIVTQSQRDRFRGPESSVPQMREALDEFKQLNPDFSYVSIVDAASGRVIAATGGIFENGSAVGRPVFEEGKKGPFLGDVHDAARLAELIAPPSNGEPLRFLDAAAPIMDPSGHVVRVIAAHIGWQWTRRVAEQTLAPVRDRHGVEIFLLDTQNKVVLSSAADVRVGTQLGNIESLALEKTKTLTWPDSKEYLTIAAATPARGRFDGFGWKVVAREPLSEALLPIQKLRFGFVIGALLMGLLASTLAWFLAARIVRPVRMLAEAASRADPTAIDELALSSGIGEVGAVQRAMHRMSQNAKRSVDASAVSERQFSVLAAALKEVVWQADAEGRLEYVNKEWIRALKPHGPFLLDDLAELLPFEDDRNRFLMSWHAALRHGHSMRVRARFHNTDVGGERWYEIFAEAVKDNDGKVTRWVGTIFDVHDVISLADRTNQALVEERAARGEAERLAQMRDEFLAIASHELRSPLSAIAGWSDILIRRGSADPVMTQAAEVIRRNATLQAALINDLLDMSAVIAGKIVINRTPIDVSELAKDVVLSHLHAAQVKGVALRSNSAEALYVEADRLRMTQVLSNLVNNAIKFTDPGGRIDIEIASGIDQAEITVRDTGRGIAPSFLPFVFDRLRQEDASVTRRAGGLGLGLAIARGLIELQDGTISAMSAGPGQGSSFTVKIPLVYGISDAPMFERADESKNIDLSGARILLVDDEKDARDVAQVALSSLGAQVKLATSAAEALDSLRQEMFDVLVSDVGMPDMDGLTLMRAIRRLPKHHNGAIAAVALTAFALESDRQAGQAAGFNCYVTKPISLRRLAEGIELARETVASDH